MPGLEDVVTNPEVVTEALGSWPSFHDAEIVAFELRRDNYQPTPKLTINTKPFPGGNEREALVTFLLSEIDGVELYDFNEQNVVDLDIATAADRHRLKLAGVYGFNGWVSFSEARVLAAKWLEGD